jgi:cyclopropane fatty-acyl-phospholipid synthase-like methyltransferase
MEIGRTKHSQGGRVAWAQYDNGTTAIVIQHPATGERELVATVNLWDPPPPPFDETEVYLKDWSENEGVVDALVAAGVVTLAGQEWPAGFCKAVLAKLTPEALADRAAQGGL